MADFLPSTDNRNMNIGSLQKQQGIKPHRPGRTITCYYCGLYYVNNICRYGAHETMRSGIGRMSKQVWGDFRATKIQNHLDNDCVNKRRPTNDLQLQIYPQQATSPQAVKNLQQYSDPTAMMEQHQVIAVLEEWNKKVVAALTVIKKALLKEENERCRAEAEWKLEFKKLNQHIQAVQNNTHRNAVTQASMTQFHELKEEVLLLKESLMDERKKRHDTELQLAYEVEKSNILYQQADDLKLKLQEYRNEIEAWKTGHEEEVNRLLQEVAQERQHRLRAETELKMEAAKLEDLCCTLEQWRDEDKCERHQLEEKHIEREVGWKEQVEQQKGEVEKLKKMVEKYCHDVDEFRKFLSSENIMISGLWAEQLAEVRSITEKLESLNKASETKFKEIAQLKQCVSECDEAITKQTRGSCSIALVSHIIWRISDFEAKMADAKENNTVLHSPVFYSSRHGYKLRVEVRLNGLGQWTGRHMTASLQVLEGEWDPLLQWPFNQRVTLTLRDQKNGSDEVNNLVKSLVEGQEKEDPAGLHVFIPHTTLQQHNYLLNNIMFLEVTVG